MGVQFSGNILVQSNGGPLPISSGGTGQTTAPAAINALLPVQTGNAGKILTTNGTDVSWLNGVLTPGGADTQIQFNDSGSFGGNAFFTVNKSTGALTSTSTFKGIGLVISDSDALYRSLKYQTLGSNRWLSQVDNGTESGANAGSDFEFVRVADNGATTNQVYTVSRATGVFDFKVAPTLNGGALSGVTTFNTRTGAITLTSTDVTDALGFTPYNATNPSGYTANTGTVTSVSGTGTVSGLTLTGSVTTSGSLTLGGTLSLTSGNVTDALGFTPYNATNPSGYTTNTGTVTSASVVSANGFTGSVATASTTPAITISTSITGVIKGNGTALSAATSGTDYSAGTSALATGIVKSTTSTGALSIAVAGDFPTLNQSTTGNASTATVLATGRTISVSSDATGTSASFDGSGNASIPLTLATVNASPQTDAFRKITVNGKGLTTATSAVSSSDITTSLGYTPVNKAGDTMTGLLVLSADPSAALGAVTKQYVDNIQAGVNIHQPCETATTGALASSTYSNGTAGVGATLTASANGALGTIGGFAGLIVNSRLLVKNQVAGLQNGVYTVTNLGSAGTPWVLTRATDFDGSPTFEVVSGDLTYVQSGTNGGTQWVQTAIGTGVNTSPAYNYVIVGTDAMVFGQFAGSGTYTAGSGISIVTNTISNTGVLSNVAGTGISVSGATGNVTVTNTGVTSIAGTANQITASAATGSVTLSLPSTITGLTSVSSTTFVGALTGNASTATSATTATNIAAGVAGNVHYQSGVGATAFVTNAAGVLQAATSGATPTWTTTPTLTGTNFTGIPNAGLTNSGITFGATSQALGSTVSALNAVSIGAATASSGAFTTLTSTGVSSVTVNSASAALTVTQTGAGNAFIVEDSASTDSTPFVIDAAGTVVIGAPTALATSQWFGTTYISPKVQIQGASTGASFGLFSYSTSASNTGQLNLGKGASNTVGTNTLVANGDYLGAINWQGADGTNLINAARIEGHIDGTPGTNDMPGRLVFSTTADGASSPTERMRIDSAGNVGIGAAVPATTKLYVVSTASAASTGEFGGYYQLTAGNTTGAATKIALTGLSTSAAGNTANFLTGVQGDAHQNAAIATTTLTGVSGRAYTLAAGTITNMVGVSSLIANAGAATVTNAFGYYIVDVAAGASNYGYYSGVTAGANKYSFYAAGTADNYFAGSVGIGGTPAAGYKLLNYGNWTGATTYYGTASQGTIQSDVTVQAAGYRSAPVTQATTFTLGQLDYFLAEGSAVGAGSTITTLAGFRSGTGLIGATTNIGFLAMNTAAVTAGKTAIGVQSNVNIATGGGNTYGFYAAGTADNLFIGRVKVNNTVVVNDIGTVGTATLTTAATTAGQVLNSVAIATYRVATYKVSITSGAAYHYTEISILQDGTNVYITEINTMKSGATLATFTADISAGNMRLLTTPTNAVTTYKAVSVLIAV